MVTAPFSRLLRWSLVVPFVATVATFFLVIPSKNGQLFFLVAVLAGFFELIPVSRALFLLKRERRYRSSGNIVPTVLGSIPLAFVLLGFVAAIFSGGSIHF